MIHLVVALKAEATPLVEALDLRGGDDRGPFRVYESETCRLVVSGVGKIAAAAAVAHLHSRHAREHSAWLNVGIGAHRTLPIGQPAMAREIVDSESKRSWALSTPRSVEIPSVTVCTVERPQRSLGDERLYEMEASGFVRRVLAESEQVSVGCLKIVSDRGVDSARALSRSQVRDLMAAGLPTVRAVIDALTADATAARAQ